jgi:hypothetical protein
MPKRRTQKKLTEIEFDFIKSNFFRVIHVDGAFGGLSPNGFVHMALYSERRAIPTKVVHKIEGAALGLKLRPVAKNERLWFGRSRPTSSSALNRLRLYGFGWLIKLKPLNG